MYTLRMARRAGGIMKLYRRMRSRNVCKTCALGMGGQRGGMTNEAGHFPEVCKKSLQAQAADMQGPFSETLLQEFPFARLERLTSAELERLGRLAFPMIAEAGDTGYRRIGWDEALSRTADAFRDAPRDAVFFYSSGRSSNEAAFLLQLVARAYGTTNINNCSCYCHSASGVGLTRVYGSGTGSVVLDDLNQADLVVVAGANPASNHPRLITQLVHLRRRGGKVIIINPLRELGLVRFRVPSDVRSMLFGSTISDLYLQPHVGSDVALFKALLKGIVEEDGIDLPFVQSHTMGWGAVEEDIKKSDWGELVKACGVAKADIDAAVRILLGARKGIFCWAMGLTHHLNGVDNVLALANVALARGWLGRPGSGLMPIRGHSNVQGVGSVGVNPVLKEAFANKLRELYDIDSGESGGMDTYQSMVAASEGRVKAAFLLGGNLFASNPDRTWAGDALSKIPFKVTMSTKLNEGHVHGRGGTMLVLPVLARDEEHQATTQESMFNFVRLSEGGTPAFAGEMRSEVDIISEFAERVLPPDRFDWSALRSHGHLREQMAKVVPGYARVARMKGPNDEFQIDGRTFHSPQFATSTGRAAFHVTQVRPLELAPGEFRLMTLRSEGQFNTVVYEEEDLYRGNTHRKVVMMAGKDASTLGLGEGAPVVVETVSGSLTVSAAIVDIAPGNIAMYYPEANVLIPHGVDPQSGTPAFKSVVARLAPVRQHRIA